ncbi:MAG: sensor histidine kinase [Kofleriaceae bacterium]
MTTLQFYAPVLDALRARVRHTIDLAAFASGALGVLIVSIDLALGTSSESVGSLAVLVAMATLGLLGLKGRAPWTPLAFVGLALVGNPVYLLNSGAWLGLGVIYVITTALAFLFLSPRWSWAISIALSSTPMIVGLASHFEMVPPAGSLALEDHRQWYRAAIASVTAMIAIALLVRFTMRKLIDARRDLEHAIVAEREQHLERQRVEDDLARARRAESIALLGAEVGADIGAALSIVAAKAHELAAELHGADAKDCLDDILDAATNASSTMRSLTVFSPDRYVPTRGNAADAVRSLPKLVRRMVPSRITLEVVTDEDAWVGISSADLVRILANLVFNARDAIADAGTIAVSVARNGSHVEITVRDSGSGMSDEVVAHLFQPFFTTKALGRGTGLGLATTKVYVERAHGTISAETMPGQTTFLIRLPYLAAER